MKSLCGLRPELLIFITALVVRLICLWNFREIPFFAQLIVDSKAYDLWGWKIAQGNWLRGQAFFQAPLYPYFIGVFYYVFGHHAVWLRVLQTVLGSLACVILQRATQAYFNRTAGIISGFMLTLYAPAVFFDCVIQKSVLDVLLLATVMMLAAPAKQSRWRTMLLGLSLGLLTLTRENALLLAPLLAAWLAIRRVDDGERRHFDWKQPALMLTGFLIAIGPVYIHNASYGARSGITTYQMGTSFYIGNGARAHGTYVPVIDERGTTENEESDARQIAEQSLNRALTPDEISRYWMRRTFGEIGHDPTRWLMLLLKKLLLTVNYLESMDTDDIYFYEQFSMTLRMLNSLWNFGMLLPISVAGMLLCRKEWRRFLILVLMAAAMAASLVMFYVVARYRHALAPLLIPLAAAGVAELAGLIGQVHRGEIHQAQILRRVLPATIAFIVMFAISRVPLTTRDAQLGTSYFNAAGAAWKLGQREVASEYFELAKKSGRDGPATEQNYGALLGEMGKTEEALAAFSRAGSAGADPALLAQNRGTAYLQAGKFQQALLEFERADSLGKPTAELENSRGVALSKLERLSEAKAAFRKAIELRPDYTFAYIHLLELAETSTVADDLLKEAGRNGADVEAIGKALGSITKK